MLVLEKYYPGVHNEKEVNDFVQLCDISHVYFCETKCLQSKNSCEVENLSQTEFYNDKKAVCINIGMGDGKTTQTVNYLEQMTQIENASQNFI